MHKKKENDVAPQASPDIGLKNEKTQKVWSTRSQVEAMP